MIIISYFGEVSKMFCALKDVEDSVCKWYPSLEVPTALLLHVTRCSIFSNTSIILPGLRASIGVTCSFSSRPFLCALVISYAALMGEGNSGRGSVYDRLWSVHSS